MNPTERLIRNSRRAQTEERRGTMVSDLRLVAYDTAGLKSRVWVGDVDANLGRPIKGVIVQSQTGTGGRAYATVGSPVIIRRNAGGRWICIGPSDRTTRTGNVQILDESTELAGAAVPGVGFNRVRRPFSFFQGGLITPGTPDSGRWGVAGFGNVVVTDTDGNEVT